MSVSSCIFTGLTLEFVRELSSADFKKYHEFIERHPELDESEYEDKEGKLLLICDGMNGDFCRLVQVDKFVDGGNLGSANEFIELSTPDHVFNPELIEKMSKLYEEYTGASATLQNFKYAMWSMWT